MTETEVAAQETTEAEASRIYEVGYLIVPTAKEEDIEKIVGMVRAEIGQAGGNLIAEGAPSLTQLAYPMSIYDGSKHLEYDRGYFGWLKFETSVEAAHALTAGLKKNVNIMRSLVFRTVREDTRAKMKPATLREVKRTDTIKSTPRRVEEEKGPVSEEELEKALQDITAE